MLMNSGSHDPRRPASSPRLGHGASAGRAAAEGVVCLHSSDSVPLKNSEVLR